MESGEEERGQQGMENRGRIEEESTGFGDAGRRLLPSWYIVVSTHTRTLQTWRKLDSSSPYSGKYDLTKSSTVRCARSIAFKEAVGRNISRPFSAIWNACMEVSPAFSALPFPFDESVQYFWADRVGYCRS